MLIRVGEYITQGQPMVNIFSPNEPRLEIARQLVDQAIHIESQAPPLRVDRPGMIWECCSQAAAFGIANS